ncbi:MAG TPA: LacI family DNA-binding transcriptional regulator [Opitutaceae bacterium]|nr:LacI family DNA-binding transcriptional regulator [Opitutaceae bacterium]
MDSPGSDHRRVTMSDVAAAAHVHKSTVSLALRNQPKLSAATGDRIRRIAAELGYRPDPMLDLFNLYRRTLEPPRTLGAIAFVSDLSNPAAFARSERHETIFASAREEAKRLNFTLELFLVGPGQLSPARLAHVLEARGITGILLGALSPVTRSLDIDWKQFCVVGIESMQLEPPVDNISTDYCHAARLVVRELRQSGRKSVGFVVAEDLGHEIEGQLRAGYLVECRAQTPVRAASFWRLDQDAGTGSLRQWITTQKLDAVVGCGVDIPELRARLSAREARRIGWASIDIRGAQSKCPRVPALHHDLGRRAIELLIMRLQNNLRGLPSNPATTLLPVEWSEYRA